MRIARTDPDNMKDLSAVHGGAGTIRFGELWGPKDFQTQWQFVHAAVLPPGGGIGHHGHEGCEEVFITIDNAAQFTHNGRTAEVRGAAAVPLRMGESHAIYNHTDRDTRWFNFHVIGADDTPRGFELNDDRAGAPLESVERLPIGRFDRDLLELSRLHGGAGRVGRREVWGPRDFRTTFGRVVHCLLPPGASIGYHRHETVEECYVIMHGSGRMTVDGETAEVSAGDAIPNALGGSHGLYNHTQDDLELFLVAVCVEKGKFDAIELNDDLTKR